MKDIERLTERGNDLKISISGVRGTIPKGLDPENIVAFAKAFANTTGKKIVIGHDARATGPMLQHLTLGVLLGAGKQVIDIGLAPTPTVKAAVKTLGANGGIMFSASHNPPEWNGFKFMGPGGFFFSAKESKQLLDSIRKNDFTARDFKAQGSYESQDAIQSHIDAVLELIPARDRIRKRRFRVVIDAVAGAGREALPRLLEELGCQVVPLFCDADPGGRFPRPPEPTRSALSRFGRLVKEKRADIGFALDPDADRLVLATPKQGAIHEEYTLAFAFMGTEVHHQASVGRRKLSPADRTLVVNLSTSTLLDSIADPLGFKILRSPVGEANVVDRMRAKRARFGGEGNGGVIHSAVPSFGRDPLTGAALILSALIETGRPADEILTGLPKLYMEKRKLPTGLALDKISKKAVSAFPGARSDSSDGLHLRLPDGAWIHLRESNTEPVIRLIAQAPKAARLKEITTRMTELASGPG